MKQRFENASRYLRLKRHEAGLTQAELTRLINKSAKCGQYISNLEKGNHSMPLKAIPAILKNINGSEHDFIEAYVKDIRRHVESVIYP